MAEPAPSDPRRLIGEPDAWQPDAGVEAVRATLDRILVSETFADSERSRALLQYLVEQELRGAGESMKEYVIGTEALGKPDSFDPKTDSVVRVQVSRLRAKLKLYYQSEGSADRLCIRVPPRSYRPVFDRCTAPAPALGRSASGRFWPLAVVICAVLVVTGVAWRIAAVRSVSLTPQTWRRLTFDTGSTCCPTVSRDGALVAYASDRNGRGDYDIYVQPANGGPSLRLTDHEERDYMPDFSPDGTRVAFASYRDGGGIYVVPVLGGESTRIIDDGDNPRFSPDGAWVAFDRELPDAAYAVFVSPASGGTPRKMTPDSMARARSPIWSQDGQYLLFVGAMREKPAEYDFWAVPFHGGEPIRAGLSVALERQGLARLQRFQPPLDWIGDHVLFPYYGNGTTHVWKIPLQVRTWQVTGRAQQLTSGGGREAYARVAVAATGKRSLIFSSGERPTHLWTFPMDSNKGVLMGSARQLTQDVSMGPTLEGTRPSLSLDGRALVYASRRWGTDDIWYQNVITGEERALAASPMEEDAPVVLRDGSAVAFARHEAGRLAILTIPLHGGQASKVCDDCGSPTDWSPDGRFILYVSAAGELGLLDLKAGKHDTLPSSNPFVSASFSPDGRWVAVAARIDGKERGFLLPFPDGRWPPEREWKPLTNLEAPAFAWSPDGSLVYFLSLDDNYRCLWAQPINLAEGRPSGRAHAIKHFHTVRGYPQMARGVAIARDRMVLRLTHERLNLWAMDLPD